MNHVPCSSRRRPARLVRCALAILAGLSIQSLPAHAQGTFGGVRVSGIEVLVEQPPRKVTAADIANNEADINRQLVQQTPRVGELVRSGGGHAPPAAKSGRPASAPATRTVYSNGNLLTSATLCAPLQDPRIRAAADLALRTVIADQINRQMGGHVVHSSSNHQLGQACSGHAEVVGQRLTVRMTIPRNRVFVRIMNSSVFSGDLDPNFFTHYDLEAVATFLLPRSTSDGIVQESLRYHVRNIDKPQSRSVTGRIAIAMNDLIGFLGGPDYIAQITHDRSGSIGSLVNLDLGALQHALRGIGSPGMRIETTHRGGMLVMRATSRPPAAGPVVN